jgi:aspartyl-tRNA(Asn)/glutamyl-tRNA(Gln) amidotransferase subunit C
MPAQFDVRYTAQLARLHLNEEEIARFQEQIGTVLEYVEKLGAVNVDEIEPTAHAFPVHNVFREDEPRDGFTAGAALKNAPRTANGLIVVPKVIE